MDIFREWILTVTGTALVASAALALAPEGGAKRSLRFICGLMMMAALMSIALKLEAFGLGEYAARYNLEAQGYIEEAMAGSRDETRFIIESRCETYILDKAEALGVRVESVEVTAAWSGGGYWYPVSAVIEGDESVELSRTIEAELGIDAGSLSWRGAYGE